MLTPTGGLLRGLRSASLGVLAYSLALVAHVAHGGPTPGGVVLLLLAGLVALAALLITKRRLGPVRVGASLAALQVVLHEAPLWLGSPASCSMTGVTAPTNMQIGHAGQALLACATGMAQTGMGSSSELAASIAVGAHVAAAALMAALLAYGQKGLCFLAGCLRPRRRLLLDLIELPAVPVISCGAPPTLGAQFACGGVGSRGPPLRGLLTIG